jgi:ATP-dependent Clp protease ATP-binding subunit ClpC
MMPKINVYLPDELADAVREAGVPVSAICQRALEQAVRRITAIRQAGLDGANDDTLAGRLPNFTVRAQTAITEAIDRSRGVDRTTVTTADLLGGVVGEGANLALQVLRAMDIDPAVVAGELDRPVPDEPDGGAGAGVGGRRFSVPAANVLEAAVAEASGFGHNYVGCEHLLLGLVGETDGAAGKILRSLGADPRLTRRAVSAALAGYVHLSAQKQAAAESDAASLATAVRREVQPLIARIERLEARLDPAA